MPPDGAEFRQVSDCRVQGTLSPTLPLGSHEMAQRLRVSSQEPLVTVSAARVFFVYCLTEALYL